MLQLNFILNKHLENLEFDEAFRLTPIVQAFPKTVLRAILGVTDGTPLRVPACYGGTPGSAPGGIFLGCPGAHHARLSPDLT